MKHLNPMRSSMKSSTLSWPTLIDLAARFSNRARAVAIRHGGVAGAFVIAISLTVSGAARAQSCTEAQITAAQDEGSATLRRLNGATAPQIDARMRDLQKARGWSDHDLEEKSYEHIEDETIRTFDREMALSEPSASLPACERLLELRQTLERMRDIAQQKSRYLMAKLDRELAAVPAAARAPVGAPVAPAPASPGPAPAAKALAKVPEPGAVEGRPQAAASPTVVQATPKPAEPALPWTTTTRETATARAEPSNQGPQPTTASPPPANAEPGTYAREEIFAAGEGFFGKLSSGLASVFDFTFQKAGRPSGYILGDEGGGALLAGVRYGKGLLYLKGQAPQRVYWRGPSFGYDVGAAGSRLMVLVYNVRDPEELFTNFGGVDGSAYVVGGVGMTFLTNGKKIMAPIRSGLGLRIGANIGYLKFSHKPSWNPF
jgi:hypothetical protein